MLTFDQYNLALQQARILKLPDTVKVQLGALMLAGFKFRLSGSELRADDQFYDLWDCTTPDGVEWVRRDLHTLIIAAEVHLKQLRGDYAH